MFLGQYHEEIEKQLNTVPHYLDQVLVKKLQSLTGLGVEDTKDKSDKKGEKLWTMMDPTTFASYLQVSNNNVQEFLGKTSEAIGKKLLIDENNFL